MIRLKMKVGLLLLASLAALVVVTSSHPLDSSFSNLDSSNSQAALIREKRTVGVLRQLFPNFSQFVDQAVAMITRMVFRVVGRLVLQGGGGLGGGGGGGGGGDGDSGGEGRISITLPTYPPLPDEDEEDSTDTTDGEDTAATTSSSPAPDEDENAVAESKNKPVRAKRATDDDDEEEDDDKEDLDSKATGDNNEVDDDDEEEAEGEDRDKRFLNFNLGGSASGGGSGLGSGNFIFDIIRLIAGGGNTPEGDAAAASADGTAKEADGTYGVGVPGPLTRLFVIANRGLASLIQDLILRMAQTSERLVNFKARLITSII